MPRPRSRNPRDQQLLMRLMADQWTVLVAVAHLSGARSPNEFAYDLLTRRLDQAARDPLVQADIANRKAYAARAAPEVVALPDRNHDSA